MPDRAERGRREAAIAALLRRLRTTHPRSVRRRQTPRGFRQALLKGEGPVGEPALRGGGTSGGDRRISDASDGSPAHRHIMPPMPPMSGMPPPAPFSFSGTSATIASVVRMFLAIEAAFCSAERVTIAGSITPAATR